MTVCRFLGCSAEPAEPGSWAPRGPAVFCAEHKRLLVGTSRRRGAREPGDDNARPAAVPRPIKPPRATRALQVARFVVAAGERGVLSDEAVDVTGADSRSSAIKIIRMAQAAGFIIRRGTKLMPGPTPVPS